MKQEVICLGQLWDPGKILDFSVQRYCKHPAHTGKWDPSQHQAPALGFIESDL